MKHLAISTAFSVRCQQTQPTFSVDESVATGRAFKNLAVQALRAMGIEKTHEIQRYSLARANGAGLSNILLSTIIDRSRIS